MIPLGILASARVAAAAGITCTYQTSAVDATDLTTYTFASQPIGTAGSSRVVVVAVAWRKAGGAPALSTVTIGGVTATIQVAADGDGTSNRVAICSAVVTSGTTADVVVTFAAASSRCGIGVWVLSGGSYTGQSANANGITDLSVGVTTQAGQAVIAVCLSLGTSSPTSTWTGASERYDANVEGGNVYHTGADVTASGTSTTVGVSTANTTQHTLLAAAFAA